MIRSRMLELSPPGPTKTGEDWRMLLDRWTDATAVFGHGWGNDRYRTGVPCGGGADVAMRRSRRVGGPQFSNVRRSQKVDAGAGRPPRHPPESAGWNHDKPRTDPTLCARDRPLR